MNHFFDNAFLFNYSDIKRVFLRHRKTIQKTGLLCGALIFAFLLLRPCVYEVEATFKQGSKQTDISSNMKEMFQQIISMSSEGGTVAIMQSKTVLRSVIEELGLQAVCNPARPSYFKNIWENLCCVCGGSLTDPDPFVFTHVFYDGEKPLQLFLKMQENQSFQLFDQKKQLLKEGKLGVKLHFDSAQFTLNRVSKDIKMGQFYPLTLCPWESIVKQVQAKLKIVQLRLDKNILKLSFYTRDRHQGAQFLNQLMLQYQNYLKSENDEICQKQLAHIEKRRDELTRYYDDALVEHAHYLKENLAKNGFIGFAQEVETLSQPKNFYTSKLFDVDLELKRLQDTKKKKSIAMQKDSEQKNKELLIRERNNLLTKVENCDLELQRAGHLDLDFNTENDFSGFGLPTAQELLVGYTRERDSLQAQIVEITYLRDQIGKPDFEMSSLGGVFEDGVTRELVSKSSSVALQLKDENNRSAREQERLLETLQTQKNFLSQYLLQTIDLKRLRLKLLDQKIASLQQTTFSLLESEKGLLKNKVNELSVKMGDLPEKWRRESLLMLKKEFGGMMLEGVSQLAEAKSMGQHIFQINSRPLDKAFLPTHPKVPRVVFYTFLACMLGSLGSFFVLFCKSLVRGLPASETTLKMSGFCVSGSLSKFCNSSLALMRENDLETLRAVAEKIVSKSHAVTVCIGGKYPDYSTSLAELLAMRGLRVLVVQCGFNDEDLPGLWHYLHKETEELPIRKKGAFDFVPSGGTSRYTAEILCSQNFQDFIAKVKPLYDVVLLYTHADAAKAEGSSLLKIADSAIITAQEETLEELRVYRDLATFIYAEEFC